VHPSFSEVKKVRSAETTGRYMAAMSRPTRHFCGFSLENKYSKTDHFGEGDR